MKKSLTNEVEDEPEVTLSKIHKQIPMLNIVFTFNIISGTEKGKNL